MNLKGLVLLILISICFLLIFKKVSFYKNDSNIKNISELKVLNYLPKESNLLFISDLEGSQSIKNIKKFFNEKTQDDFFFLKNSTLAYLGFDPGENELLDIYNNEIAISMYENDRQNKDDILLVFKIKPEKNLNDILNLSYNIDQPEELIEIYRENKLNYLKYIYQTKDDYIISSSNKDLILKAIEANNKLEKSIYLQEIDRNFQNEKNILFAKYPKYDLLLDDKILPLVEEEIFGTKFILEKQDLLLKSFLINEKKNLDIFSYDRLVDEFRSNFDITIYGDLNNATKYITPIANKFEKSFFNGLQEKLKQNILLLISNNNWIVILDKNYENNLFLNNNQNLNELNKYSLVEGNNIYSIYSKNILSKEEDLIKQVNYDNIFSIESDQLFFISNKLLKEDEINLFSQMFLNYKNNYDSQDFIYENIDIKNSSSKKLRFISDMKNLNLFVDSINNFSISELKGIFKQSIPENNPKIYLETRFAFSE